MGILTGVLQRIKGSVGGMTFSSGDGNKAYVREKTDGNKSHTHAQMVQRVKWPNVSRAWKSLKGVLSKAFENSGGRDCNAFVKANIKLTPVYLTKDESDKGATVVAEFLVSNGSLPSIEVTLDDNHIPHSDISLGSLTIDENTRFKDFSAAVINNNDAFAKGDILTVLYAEQKYNEGLAIPYFTTHAEQLVLKPTASEHVKLSALVDLRYFGSSDGHLACTTPIVGGLTWIHSRNSDDGLLVSTQNLAVYNPTLANYRGAEALEAAIKSYGGAEDAAYLATSDEDFDDKLSQVFSESGSSATGTTTTTNHTLTVSASPSAGGTVTGGGTYASGTQVTLTASANTGYSFTQWSDGITTATRTVTVTEDKTLTAQFTASGSGSGSDAGTGTGTGGDDLMG